MRRGTLRRLRVTGHGKQPAEVAFHPSLTFITGISNTGKSHILKCVDFALGAPSPKHEFDEARGYQRVMLELGTDKGAVTVRRTFDRDDLAEWFPGPIDDWDDEQVEELQVKVDRTKPRMTLGGRILDACGFDPTMLLVKNQKGTTQALSFRAMSHFFVVSEEEVISEASPVAPPSFAPTAARSAFGLMLSGRAPSEDEIQRLQGAHEQRERAEHQIAALEPIIEALRAEILEAGDDRGELEREVGAIDQRLASLSEAVSASGDAARALMKERNAALAAAETARARRARASCRSHAGCSVG